MTLQGLVKLDHAEIKKAISEYVGKAHGIAVDPDGVFLAPSGLNWTDGFVAHAKVPVTVKGEDER